MWVNDKQDDGSVIPRRLGVVGNHVRVIIPPEEKDDAAERMRCACAMFKSNDWTLDDCRRVWLGEAEEKKGLGAKVMVDMLMTERDRADRYEKALREIAEGTGWQFDDCRAACFLRNRERIAREVLDEQDTD